MPNNLAEAIDATAPGMLGDDKGSRWVESVDGVKVIMAVFQEGSSTVQFNVRGIFDVIDEIVQAFNINLCCTIWQNLSNRGRHLHKAMALRLNQISIHASCTDGRIVFITCKFHTLE